MSWLKNLLRRNVLQKNIAFDVQEEDHKLYYYTEAGKTPRDENNVKNYILFIIVKPVALLKQRTFC